MLINQVSCQQKTKSSRENISSENSTVSTLQIPASIEKIVKSSEIWKSELSKEAYYVLREHGTERAFTGSYWDLHDPGIYCCKACGLPLFNADDKFDSGTGWPSFTKPLQKKVVLEKSDDSYGMKRVEILCARCEGHLGHVFDDGPLPTGLRYCMNSVSLHFVKNAQVKE
ncbi:MAG: peptide-methionine (R)-S-oxide reductase MsrB [Saprospiraceae bacterium]|nr:peptide-methionine (R)-S-oxide reductase MsrB [Saprospiraceae bacterium]